MLTIVPFAVFLFGTTSDCSKVGLVLSGGGARGFAHIGTLKMLDSLDIKVDYIVGTSMGAVVGALYATGNSGKEIEKLAFDLDWNELLTDTPERQDLPHFQKKDTGKYQLEFGIDGVKPVTPIGYIHGQKVLLVLSRLFGEYEQALSFDDFPIPFRCIATDIVTGNEIIFSDGSLTEAVRSSLTVPTIFSPVTIGDSLLVDGGLLNNLPTDVAINLGADIIIAVDAGTPRKSRKQLKNAMDVLEQVISIHEYTREEENAKLADFLIRPKLDGFRSVNFNRTKLKTINNLGHIAALENIELFHELKNVSFCDNDIDLISENVENRKISKTISSIEFVGNRKFKDGFLKQNLGVEIGDVFNSVDLQDRIMQLYSLGYFTTIYFTINPESHDKIGLVIKVKENLSNKMRLGIQWDKELELIAVIDFQLSDLLISGLRLEHQFQFVGLRKNTMNLFYPSRTMDFPIYPFIRVYDLKIPFEQYNKDGTINRYTYQSQMAGAGVGLQLKNKWFVESEYVKEIVNIESDIPSSETDESLFTNEPVNKIFVSSKLDLLDDILLPRTGNLLSVNFEYSGQLTGSVLEYSWLEIYSDLFYTVNDHTFRLKNYYSNFTNLSFPYLFHYSDTRNRSFSFSDNQLFGINSILNQFEYRYEYKKDIFFKILLNDVMYSESDDAEFDKHSIGYGFGVTLISPLGPMELVLSWGDKSVYNQDEFQYHFKFNAGYKF